MEQPLTMSENDLTEIGIAYCPSWRLSVAELCQHLVRVIEDVSLLLDTHVDWIFVTVAVETNLMAFVTDHSTLLREGLKTVTWNEPGSFHIILIEELEESFHTNSSGKVPTTDIAR